MALHQGLRRQDDLSWKQLPSESCNCCVILMRICDMKLMKLSKSYYSLYYDSLIILLEMPHQIFLRLIGILPDSNLLVEEFPRKTFPPRFENKKFKNLNHLSSNICLNSVTFSWDYVTLMSDDSSRIRILHHESLLWKQRALKMNPEMSWRSWQWSAPSSCLWGQGSSASTVYWHPPASK